VTHEFRYSINGKIQDEKVSDEGKHTVLILRSKGGLPHDNSCHTIIVNEMLRCDRRMDRGLYHHLRTHLEHSPKQC